MKYCTHCGKELFDEAVICPGCGCEVKAKSAEIRELVYGNTASDNAAADSTAVVMNPEGMTANGQPTPQTMRKIKFDKKVVLISVVSVVVLAAVLTAGIFLYHAIRTEQVKKQLAGRSFTYFDSTDYTYIANHYTRKKFSFDDDAQCEYTFYYSSVMDEPSTYSRSYKIKFKDGMTFLVAHSDTYEIQYDKYGRIDSLYDVRSKELYD